MTSRNAFLAVCALSATIMAVATPMARADDFVWTGGSGTSDWGTVDNWFPFSGPPGPGDDILFDFAGNTAIVNLNGNRTVSSVNFEGPNGFTLNNNFLLLESGVLSATGGATHTFNSELTIPLNGALNIEGATTVLLNGDLTSNFTLTKSGAGTLVLAKGKVFFDGGSMVISGGRVQVADPRALAGETVSINVDNGLDITTSGVDAILAGLAGTGDLDVGSQTLSVGESFVDVTTTFSGDLTGDGALTKIGTLGTLTLAGNNTYRGGTNFNGATVAVSADNHLGAATGPLSFDGGRLRFEASFDPAGTRAIALSGGGGILDTNGFDATISQSITGAGGLTKSGAGTLTLTGASTYAGGTVLDEGVLRIGNGATTGSIPGDVTNDASLLFDRSNDLIMAGAVSGSGSLTKQGAGTLTLSAVNTYIGGTTLGGGTLSLGNDSAAGSGPIAVLGSTIDYADSVSIANSIELRNDVTLNQAAGAAGQSGIISETGGSFRVTKTGAGTLALSGANSYTGGTRLHGGTVAVSTDANLGGATGPLAFDGGSLRMDAFFRTAQTRAVTLAAGGGTVETSAANTITAAIIGPGDLTKTGSGGLTLTAPGSSYRATFVESGNLGIGFDGLINEPTSVTNSGDSVIAGPVSPRLARARSP